METKKEKTPQKADEQEIKMTVGERANEIKRKETAKSGLHREFSERERERLYLKKRQTNEA